jgi:hypothetical protein
MTHKNEQTVAHQAADVVDNVADGIRSAAHTVRQTAGRAASAVGDTYEGAEQFARDSVNHGRARLRSWENSFESSISENPKTSLLLAVALGLVIGAWWKRK